ncbi:hypothetical protein Hanom_Chr01g00089141 [Helianthus anomalus]
MNRTFVFWKRVLNLCWIKFLCTESNVQVTVERLVFSGNRFSISVGSASCKYQLEFSILAGKNIRAMSDNG